MRTSSINILMAAVALFDIFTNFQQIEIIFERNTSIFFECFPTDTYGVILTRAIFDIVNDYSRRCSTWFIVSIAFMRTLMVRNPLHSTYQSLGNPNASVIVISGVCAASLPISIFKFFETQFFVVTESLYVCALQGTYYLAAMSHFFMKNNGFIAKYFSLFNSFVSDVWPFEIQSDINKIISDHSMSTATNCNRVTCYGFMENRQEKSKYCVC